MTRGACLLLTISLLVALPDLSPADLFYKTEKAIRLTDSGLNPAANGSIPFSVTGMNNAGSFTGFFPSATANKLHAFLWNNTSKTFLDLNNLLAADSSMATCLNETGTVAGVFWELGTYAEKGFIFYPDGTVSTFTGPDSHHGDVTAVTAINPAGSIIGTYTADNYTERGFIVQQTATASTIVDLGDVDAGGSYTAYLWPNALNDLSQVVGNVYLFPTHNNQTSLTNGFFWDGGMTLIDASGLSGNWTAMALNNGGQAVGWYDLASAGNEPFSVVGSYVWDGSNATDIGDLGGGNGANAFAIRDSGTAFGTSLVADGSLHLFRTGRQITDLGSSALFTGDTSFQPTGLSLTSVTDSFVDVGRIENLDFAGFGTDAVGNTRAMLWKDDGMHSVIDLMPAYLSFAAISNAYGSKVLVNSSEQIACAGQDAAGHQMALLLSIDPDSDNDGLPDIWEMQYYGHLGVRKNDLEQGGGGLTNWQAYQQGTDPNDFYNGQQPSLFIADGNNQVTEQNTVLPQPMVVAVYSEHGVLLIDAPVTFAVVAGGGHLCLSSAGGNPATHLDVRTDTNGRVAVWFLAPAVQPHVVNTSTITTTAGVCVPALPVSFTEQSMIGETVAPAEPTDFVEINNLDGSRDLSWKNHACNAVSISIDKRDEYGQWAELAILPPDRTSAHINPDGTLAPLP